MSEQHPLRAPAVAWFNATWDLIEKPDRSSEETLQMLASAAASYAAWEAVPEHGPTEESVGAWLLARVHALAGEGRLAEAWARRSLAAAQAPAGAGGAPLDPFYPAAAREALARAYRVQGRPEEVLTEVSLARELLRSSAETELASLLADLAELEASPGSGRLYSISIHHPRPAFADRVADSMHRYGAAARSQAGLLEVRTLRELSGSTLVGMAVWESAEAKAKANPALGAAVAGDDFAAWEEGEMEGWALGAI